TKQLAETLGPSSTFIYLPSRQTADYRVYGETKPGTDIRFETSSGITSLLNNLQNENYVYLEPGRPWPAELWAEQARLKVLKTMVIARLQGRKDLVGFVSIGAPLSEAGIYQYEE